MEPFRLTATEVATKIKSGELTVVEYAKSLLSRIEQRDSAVKAWAYLDHEHVLAEAKRLDEVPPDKRGPLHGVGVAVKDVIYTKGEYNPPREKVSDVQRYANSTQFNYIRK